MMARRPVLLTLMAAGMVIPLAPAAFAHESGAKYTRPPLTQAPQTEGEGVAMEFVKNLQYPILPNGDANENQRGTDIEFMTLGSKDYAVAGTGFNGMHIVDITDPKNPSLAGRYDCPINQGDVQIFRQGKRVLATYTADSTIAASDNDGMRTPRNQLRFESQCVSDAIELQPTDAESPFDGNQLGTFIVDLTNPAKPTTVGFLEVPEGSHNQTVHPSGEYLYNSNSDLLGLGGLPEITIHKITDPSRPEKIQDFTFPPVPTSLGTESHDIFFNSTGTRAYVAALSSTLILDTTKPEAPKIITQFADPANMVVHQSDVVSLPREDGTVRELLVTTDEQAGALEQSNCPGGGLHVYDITGDKAKDPLRNKLGTFFIPVVEPRPGQTCTSHVLRMYPEQGLMTIAWYTAGVRVLDIAGLAETGVDPNVAPDGEAAGLKEIGHFELPDSDTWSFKTNRIEADGSFFGYGNDIARGFDVYRFDGTDAELGRTVPVLAPENLAAPGCEGVPVASAYVDRDTAREVHKRGIDCVIARSIAQGSVNAQGSKVYRPLEDVSRGQMATFILNTLRASGQDSELPEPKAGAFDDTAESVHENAIEVLAAAGIVQGVSGGKSYAPLAPVTREQMASFMVRAAQFAVEPNLAETGSRRFTDVADGSTHADNIAIGDDNGLFQGTTDTTFSPQVQVKRDQMATFLTNLLGVAGGGNATPPSGTSTQP